MKKLYVACFAFLAIASCKKDSVTTYDCTGVAPTYTTGIKAIMDANCASSGCHSAASHEKNVDLSSYTATKAAAANASFLGSIQHKSGYKAMPQGGSSLSDAEIKLISCWVQNQMPQ